MTWNGDDQVTFCVPYSYCIVIGAWQNAEKRKSKYLNTYVNKDFSLDNYYKWMKTNYS